MLANVGNISYYSSNAAVCWHVALEKYSGNNEATFSFSACRTENLQKEMKFIDSRKLTYTAMKLY